VHLKENPTTGYRWRLWEWDTSVLGLTEDHFRAPTTTKAGAGGEHSWIARAPGETVVAMSYERSWDTAAPIREFRLNVSVAAGAGADQDSPPPDRR